MKKSFNAVPDTRTDCLDQTRRLYRGVTDVAQRLDEQRVRSLTITDIFTPLAESLRAKLRDYCERLIFKDPVGHARKTEELLWRRGFYDTIAAAKKLRKGNAWDDLEKALLSAHLAVGVGFYHHLILRLQLECNLELMGIIDFAYPPNKDGIYNSKNKTAHHKMHAEDVRQCATRFIHRSLICLGDIARYRLDLDSSWDPKIAARYYKTAILINPNIGMPHNQLGTMSGTRNYGLDAVYHYMRCILCPDPFEGAEGNLKRVIATQLSNDNQDVPLQSCITRLLSLLQLWNSDAPASDELNQACQEFLTNIENCLTIETCRTNNDEWKAEDDDSIAEFLERFKDHQPSYLTNEMVYKILVICFMTIVKLQSKESPNVHGVIAFTLAIFSQLLQITIEHIQDLIIDISLPNTVEFIPSDNQFIDLIDISQNGVSTKEENETNIRDVQNSSDHKDNVLDTNDNKKAFTGDENEAEDVNNSSKSNGTKKSKGKSKSLLTKLRRPRRRRNSSDSDASDGEGHTIESSSDEMNSNISEMEEDALSEGIILSDDALSDELSDTEGTTHVKTNQQISDVGQDIKGTYNSIPVNGQECENNIIADTILNGVSQPKSEADDMDPITNSSSAVTLTTNADSSSTYDGNIGSMTTMDYITQLKKQNLDSAEILKILMGEGIIRSIKIGCDWLTNNPEIIQSCAQSSRLLLKRICTFLNLINVDPQSFLDNADAAFAFQNLTNQNLDKCIDTVPLPEDIDLKGLKTLKGTQQNLDWEFFMKFKINHKEETLLRTLKLVKFGHFLCSVCGSGVHYKNDTRLFVAEDSANSKDTEQNSKKNNKNTETEHPSGKLMRHMGKLWLKAEVRALETRLRSRLISPYLVPDHEALAKYTPTLKRLVYAKKFIVVIPSVVVSALDEVKRTSGKAREATRWLEAQLKRGSRFLRAQRPHERLSLPLVKGPKPKNKEAWLYFQIIECCHYLTNQTKVNFTSEAEAPVVTLLTGCSPDEQKTANFSPVGLTKSAGINLEHIESFHTKWKASSKSHG